MPKVDWFAVPHNRIVYCDLDGVLVQQTGKTGFDTMPWKEDGRKLWDWLKPFNPTLLSQLPDKTYDQCAPEKRCWVRRELGPDFVAVICRDSKGKAPYARPGAVLIDDSTRHMDGWVNAGGTFVLHESAEKSIWQTAQFLLRP